MKIYNDRKLFELILETFEENYCMCYIEVIRWTYRLLNDYLIKWYNLQGVVSICHWSLIYSLLWHMLVYICIHFFKGDGRCIFALDGTVSLFAGSLHHFFTLIFPECPACRSKDFDPWPSRYMCMLCIPL